MPSPTTVNPHNFKVKSVIFDNNVFSVAIGTWKNQTNMLAMRWNGDDSGDAGYPKTFGNPVWFVIHEDLNQPIIQGLISQDPQLANQILDSI